MCNFVILSKARKNMIKNREIKLGKYKHFKGHLYNVVGVAKHTEDPEKEFVIYEYTHDDGKIQLWARPKEMFLEKMELKGKKVPRFEYIGK